MSVLIVYATLSGHTEELAEMIKERLEKAGLEVLVEEAYDTEAGNFHEYEAVILGSYTWGDGDVPDDMMDLYEELEEKDLHGHQFAVFGSGDTGYMHFAGAVDHL
ncbi:MAG: flavodoxin, partial [Alkalicoccus sp.]